MHRLLIFFLFACGSLSAQQPIDSAYTARIRELTPTDPNWKFSTELVDYLPASATVPTPLKILGYVPGTIGKWSHVADVNRYFRALAAASPRVKIFTLGMSDEGREMLVAAIADDAKLTRLEEFRGMLSQLADPRGLAPAERARLVQNAKPIYWLTGSIHSPETGSPEMLMELAYRMAVDESECIRAIRSNVITLITPVLELDGRDRRVDLYGQGRALRMGQAASPKTRDTSITTRENEAQTDPEITAELARLRARPVLQRSRFVLRHPALLALGVAGELRAGAECPGKLEQLR